MHVDVRPVSRLRGADPVKVMASLGPVVETLCAGAVDLSRLSVVCDWIQYRASFREVAEADFRPVLAVPWRTAANPDGTAPYEDQAQDRQPPEAALEVAIDLRRCADADLPDLIGKLLQEHANPAASTRVPLEPWGTGAHSCIWQFNALYWQALSCWEQATGREYEVALPGGESDVCNAEAVRELILELFKVWDDLHARGALPPSCTWWNSGWATAIRPGPGWTNSRRCPRCTAGTTTGACTTSWAITRRMCSAGR